MLSESAIIRIGIPEKKQKRDKNEILTKKYYIKRKICAPAIARNTGIIWGGIPIRCAFWLDQWDSQEEVRMLTEQLSDFLYEVRYDSLPSKAVDNAKLYLGDLLGVAAAGSVQPQ